jgi:hypothetical protein
METVEEIISDARLDEVWGHANFGSMPKRDIIKYSLLKCVGGYYTGHTAKTILKELNLVYANEWKITKLGGRYLFAAFYDGVSV